MKYKVIWTRRRDEHEDKEFESLAKAIRYVNNAYPDVEFRTTDIQLIGPEKEELVFDWYGKITACIIKLDQSNKSITEEIIEKILERKNKRDDIDLQVKELNEKLRKITG